MKRDERKRSNRLRILFIILLLFRFVFYVYVFSCHLSFVARHNRQLIASSFGARIKTDKIARSSVVCLCLDFISVLFAFIYSYIFCCCFLVSLRFVEFAALNLFMLVDCFGGWLCRRVPFFSLSFSFVIFCFFALCRNDCCKRHRNFHLCDQTDRNDWRESVGWKNSIEFSLLIRSMPPLLDTAFYLFILMTNDGSRTIERMRNQRHK